MINYREIFDVSNSLIGVIVILLLMVLIVFFYKVEGIKIIRDSFFIVSFLFVAMYFVGGIIINSFSYKFFIEIISNTFFGYVIIFGIFSLVIGFFSSLLYKYIR